MQFIPQKAVKGQVVADFLADQSSSRNVKTLWRDYRS